MYDYNYIPPKENDDERIPFGAWIGAIGFCVAMFMTMVVGTAAGY